MPHGRSQVEPLLGPGALRWRSLPFEAATRVTLALTIFFVLCGSASVPELVDVGSPLRWAALASLTALALAWSVAEGADAWDLFRFGGFGLLLAALGLVSAAWSIDSIYTLKRVLAFAFVALAAAAAAAAARGSPERVEGLAETIVVASLVICLGGVVVYAVDPTEGAQAATVGTAFRFAGLGQSPNTVSMLASVAAALAAWLSLVRSGRVRVVFAGALFVFCAEVAASGSRGAALSIAVGAVVFVVLAPAGLRARLALFLGALVVAGGVIGANRVIQDTTAKPEPAAPPTPSVATQPKSAVTYPRIVLPPFQNELGTVPVGARTFFGNDGRAQALQEAFDEGSERPLLGWGFGMEVRAFIERSAQFESSRPEDSYLGLYLELGAAGVLLWVLAGVATLAAVVRARSLDRRARLGVAGAAAAVAIGFALAVGQSYVYAAGNVATLSVWLAVALAAAIAGRRSAPQPRRPWRATLVAAVVLVVAMPVGIWERGRARSEQNAGMFGVWREVGGALAQSNLDGFRRDPPQSCLLYAAGGTPAGYELCFDRGRLVQAIDRRNGRFHAWTVQQFGASAATFALPPGAVNAQLRRLGAYGPTVRLGYAYQARPPR